MKTLLTTTDKKLHDQFSAYGLRAKEWMRKCVMLLPEIEKRQIWRKKGFSSIYEYAAKIAGMSRNSVNEALRVFEKIADKPELQKIAEMRGINAVKPVVTIATKDTAAFWAEKAKEMTKNTLETYVREVKNGRLSKEEQGMSIVKNEEISADSSLFAEKQSMDIVGSNEMGINYAMFEENHNLIDRCILNTENMNTGSDERGANQETRLPRKAIIMEVDSEIAEKLEKLKGQDSWNEVMKELLELREEKLKSEKPESAQTNSRYIPVKIKKYSLKKTRGICAFPGCTKSYKILHHTKRFALTNEHEAESLQPLCKAHENLAHLGLIENEQGSPENWRLLRHPHLDHPTYEIDMAVQKIRQKAVIG